MNGNFPLDEQRALEEFKRLSDLFQFYLQLVLNTFIFALGIAGGVCAFVLGKDNPHPRLAAFGLLLPATLCIGLGVAFLRGMDSSFELNQALQALKRYLNRTLAPHAINLTKSLQWLGYLLIISGLGLLLLWGYVSLGLSQHHEDKKARKSLSSSV